jgi:hypothetical protein
MGLGALMAASESEYRQTREVQDKNEEPTSISIKEIVANPYQPRKVFDKELLTELAASIKEHGIIQPLIVRKQEQALRTGGRGAPFAGGPAGTS